MKPVLSANSIEKSERALESSIADGFERIGLTPSMLEIALDCQKRGWFVFPCKYHSKEPLGAFVPRGYLDASNDEAKIRHWWTVKPEANVAIACGASDLVVVDCDHGNTNLADAVHWRTATEASGELPRTYTVRTGRRWDRLDPSKPEYALQMYYRGAQPGSGTFELLGRSGDVQSIGDYVMAAGSIHPDSGEAYEVWDDSDVTDASEFVLQHAGEAKNRGEIVQAEESDIFAWREWLLRYCLHNRIELRDFEKPVANGVWFGVVCPFLETHGSGAGEASSTVLGVLDGKLAFECSHNGCKSAGNNTATLKAAMTAIFGSFDTEPGTVPELFFSGKTLPIETQPRDWRQLFHSRREVLDCPPPRFLIDQFLACESICAIAAPVAQRKSLIALNIARSLCTGAALFGRLDVKIRPSRVLYLCPEMGLVSMSDRVRKMALGDSLGETLFIRSMNLKMLELLDIPEEALRDSVLIIDTAIRFLKGDENSSEDMQVFSDTLFTVLRRIGPDGAIVALYHSPKTTKDASELTLENCLRGSGELGAAITDAHGTRLQDSSDTHGSLSFIRHIKARDYEGLPDFEVSCSRETGIMEAVGDFKTKAVLQVQVGGVKANRDGKDDMARAIIRENLGKTVPQIIALLNEHDIDRKTTWVTKVRLDEKKAKSSSGVTLHSD